MADVQDNRPGEEEEEEEEIDESVSFHAHSVPFRLLTIARPIRL